MCAPVCTVIVIRKTASAPWHNYWAQTENNHAFCNAHDAHCTHHRKQEIFSNAFTTLCTVSCDSLLLSFMWPAFFCEIMRVWFAKQIRRLLVDWNRIESSVLCNHTHTAAVRNKRRRKWSKRVLIAKAIRVESSSGNQIGFVIPVTSPHPPLPLSLSLYLVLFVNLLAQWNSIRFNS